MLHFKWTIYKIWDVAYYRNLDIVRNENFFLFCFLDFLCYELQIYRYNSFMMHNKFWTGVRMRKINRCVFRSFFSVFLQSILKLLYVSTYICSNSWLNLSSIRLLFSIMYLCHILKISFICSCYIFYLICNVLW
jgi:hypothetical protein